MPLLDYAGTLRAGQSLVPDFRLQKMQDEQFAFQREEMQMRRDEMERLRAAAERAEQQQVEFRQRMEQVMGGGGRPDDVTRLMLDFPEMAEAYKPVLERMDAEQKESDITATGSIYSRLNAGDTTGAASLLRQRVEADRAAGVEDPQDVALLQALESGDETEVKVAKSMIGMHLAAMTGVEAFESIYGGEENRVGVQREYDWRVNQFGQEAADRWLATQDLDLVAVDRGGSVYNKADFVNGGATPPVNAEGGDQSVAAGMPQNGPIGPWIEQAAGITASSRKRATGVPGTYHADDNARDFPTPTIAENVREGRRLKALFGPNFDVIYSENDKTGRHNDHVHVEPGPRLGAQIRGRGNAPVKVATKQQYERLPSGTKYIAPDGTERTKP